MKKLRLLLIPLFIFSCESSICESRRPIFLPEIKGYVIKKYTAIEGGRPIGHFIVKNYTDSIYNIDWAQGDLGFEKMLEGDSIYKPKRSLHLALYRNGKMIMQDYNLDAGCSSLRK